MCEIEKVIFKTEDQASEFVELETPELEHIGSPSSFAYVYPIDDDKVLRVGGSDDKPYINWITTVAQYAGHTLADRYLPKIYSIKFVYKEMNHRGEKYDEPRLVATLVVMERLRETPTLLNADDRRRAESDVKGLLVGLDSTPLYSRDKFAKKLSEVVRNALYGKFEKYNVLRPVHRDLIDLILIAYNIEERHCIDLHAQNVMARMRGFVVTDPLS